MRVEFSKFVESDLEAIADYIEQDNPRRAVSFIREMRERIQKVGRNPLAYRVRPELGEDAGMAVVGRYVILFRVVVDVVRIERVVVWRPRPAGVAGGRVISHVVSHLGSRAQSLTFSTFLRYPVAAHPGKSDSDVACFRLCTTVC